ncbi:fungal specific transcription factor domain-containing protein [Rutstroemia sp. NJR-2017a WRK4]|nr:fungal specific transcription factor domain-containing protein [Rutstroemia sp. NJR-2017a WRK4]
MALTMIQDPAGMSLQPSIEFCKIATALQDRFARHPLISGDEILDYDDRVVRSQNGLPKVLQNTHPTPSTLRMARVLMNARYQNLRLVLYRPRLLTSTVLRTSSYSELSSDEEVIVKRCRDIASQIIDEAQKDWFPVQRVFMFNACMVPLLSLLSDPSHDEAEKMCSWSPVVERTREVVAAIYEITNGSTVLDSSIGLEAELDFCWDTWND